MHGNDGLLTYLVAHIPIPSSLSKPDQSTNMAAETAGDHSMEIESTKIEDLSSLKNFRPMENDFFSQSNQINPKNLDLSIPKDKVSIFGLNCLIYCCRIKNE